MSKGREAILALADGRIFRGRAFGAIGEAVGEAVFNTAMTGYQEVLTDPSYKGQLVCMTYPEIGNVGINAEDAESRRVYVEGFIVKEYLPRPSNWRSEESLGDYLKAAGVVAIEGIDTRALVRHIPNPSSGGRISDTAVADFLRTDGPGPEFAALRRLLDSAADDPQDRSRKPAADVT